MAESLHCSSGTITTLLIGYACILSQFSNVQLFVTLWTSPPGSSVHGMDSPGQNTGVGCYALFQGDLPEPGIKPASLMSPALAGRFFTTSTTWEAH